MSSTYSDTHREIVEGCKKNNRQAQQQLYKLYAKAMYNIAMRILNNTGEAEDVLQEAFFEAYKKIGSFKAESSIGAWLKKIVINRSINQLKKRKVVWLSVDNSPDMREDLSQKENEEATQWQVEKVHKGIQLLPDGFRTVLSLYLLEGYDHKEIAEICGISESTSKTQYNRAKKKLLEIIKNI
ncbi:MAG: RNA polymerase sigma factor [Cytophagales bacterium]|nr:MAG: RNA polymerase sigma factor [Cytophagales bacterium]